MSYFSPHFLLETSSTGSLLPDVLEKIRARRKRKLAIMLPVMMANLPKKGQGRQQAIPTVSPSKVPKMPIKTSAVQPEISRPIKSATSTSIAGTSRLKTNRCDMDEMKANAIEDCSGHGVDNSVMDHDYCSAGSSLTVDNEVEITLDALTDIDVSCVGNEVDVLEQHSCDNGISDEASSSGVSDVGPMRNLTCDDLEEGEVMDDGTNNNVCDNEPTGKENENRRQKFTMLKRTSSSKRHYREKRDESPVPTSDKYFDKLPSYCTDLSMPIKLPKKKPDSQKEITLLDYISRDPSPTRDLSAAYSKLPAYHSCFTNSTRYDGHSTKETVTEKDDEYPKSYRKRDSRSRSYSRSRSRSRDRGRSRRKRSYSSESGSSSDSR